MKSSKITAGFLSRAGAETPLNFREKFLVFPRTILENFSGVDTQTAVLVSTAEVWISAPDTQTPIFLGFLGIHSWLWFFCRETKIFRFFFLRCLSRKSGSQHQLRIKTLPSKNTIKWGFDVINILSFINSKICASKLPLPNRFFGPWAARWMVG